VAASFATVLCLPVLAWLVLTGRFSGTPLLLACVAGVLSSIVPYVTDLLALRRVPPRLFAITMSLNPLFAATAGAVVLDEPIHIHEWVGISVIVLVNVIAGRANRPPVTYRRPPAPVTKIDLGSG
jgi:inner membrane transporter RhtA